MKVKSLQESLPQPIPSPKLLLEALDSRLQSHQDLKGGETTVQPAPAQTSSPMLFLEGSGCCETHGPFKGTKNNKVNVYMLCVYVFSLNI